MPLTLLMFAALVAVAPPRAKQGVVDETIDRAVATYAKLKTAKATFEQTITNPLTGSVVKSRGEFEQQQPNRFALRFTDPKNDRIVSDGRAVWLYLPSTNPGQVIRMPVGESTVGSLDLAGQFFTAPRTKYVIADAGAATINGRATRALTLTPKRPMQSFTKAKVWIDVADGTLRQFETTEQSGLKRLVTVTALSLNVPVNGKSFSFSPPKGVRIIDEAAIRGTR